MPSSSHLISRKIFTFFLLLACTALMAQDVPIISGGIGFFNAGSARATAIVPQPSSASSLTAWESRPDFHYTGTNEDGDDEEVKTGKGMK